MHHHDILNIELKYTNTNWIFLNLFVYTSDGDTKSSQAKKKNMRVSGFPTLPSFWHPTLNFFLNRFTRFRRKSSDSAKEKIGKTI